MRTGNAPTVPHVQRYDDDFQARHALRRWEQKTRQLKADRAELRRFGFQEDTFAPERVGLLPGEPDVEELIGALEDAAERSSVDDAERFLDWD